MSIDKKGDAETNLKPPLCKGSLLVSCPKNKKARGFCPRAGGYLVVWKTKY